MHFTKAMKIILATRKRLAEKMMWEKYLVELNHMDKDNFISFDKYKERIYMLTESQLRTPEEKEEFKKRAREKAIKAMKVLDPKRDFIFVGKRADERKNKIKELTKVLQLILLKKGGN